MTQQPCWRLAHDLGDIGNIYVDDTGVYPPEVEIRDELPEDMWLVREREREDPEDEGPQEAEPVPTVEVSRVQLETCELHDGRLGSFDARGVFHREWFEDDAHDFAECDAAREGYCARCRSHVSHSLTAAAQCCDHEGGVEGLRRDFTSQDALVLFGAYATVAGYSGWRNFDSYPLVMTDDEWDERCTRALQYRRGT